MTRLLRLTEPRSVRLMARVQFKQEQAAFHEPVDSPVENWTLRIVSGAVRSASSHWVHRLCAERYTAIGVGNLPLSRRLDLGHAVRSAHCTSLEQDVHVEQQSRLLTTETVQRKSGPRRDLDHVERNALGIDGCVPAGRGAVP